MLYALGDIGAVVWAKFEGENKKKTVSLNRQTDLILLPDFKVYHLQ